MSKFHTRVGRFLKVLRNKITQQRQMQIKSNQEMGIDTEGDVDEIGLTLDPLFAQKSLSFTNKSITELEHFDKFFAQL